MDECVEGNITKPILNPPVPGDLGGVDVVRGNDRVLVDPAVVRVEQHDGLLGNALTRQHHRIVAVAEDPLLTGGEEGGVKAVQN